MSFPILAVLFGALAALFLVTAIYTLRSGLRIQSYEGRAVGKVIEIQRLGRQESRTPDYRPVFSYTTEEGEEFTRPFAVMSRRKDVFQVGEVVPLCYDKADPTRFAPEGDTSMVLSSVPYFFGAAICAALAAFILA